MGQWTKRALGVAAAGILAVAGTAVLVPTSSEASAAPHRAQVSGPGVSTSFWLTTAAGAVYSFGVPSYGSPAGPLNKPVVTVTPTPDHRGYWMAATDGGIFSYGDAHFYGSTGALTLNKPIVGMAATHDGAGYWLVASDGGIFSFGDARFYGSTGALTLNKPIVGMAPTPDGAGYWLVASDGGIFSFGDARFYGSTGAIVLNRPVVGMAPTPDGAGYWLIATDGGIFSFGDAHFYGSTGAVTRGDPVERVVSTTSGSGYWIVEQNGTAMPFGDATGQSPPPLGLVFTPVTPGDRAVLFAFQQLGKPYIWGGNGPLGYDCSGLVLASWSHADGISFARVANDQYHTAGVPVALENLQTGDLLFWGDSQTDWTTVCLLYTSPSPRDRTRSRMPS